jgi:hypothetical protein
VSTSFTSYTELGLNNYHIQSFIDNVKSEATVIITRMSVKILETAEFKVKFSPFKEIVVMQKTAFSSPDHIARFASILAGGKTPGLYWANGVVFVYFPLPASTEIAAKDLVENRRVYWTFVGYAIMPEYKPIIETKEKIMVPIIDMSSNKMFQRVADWLKTLK